MNMKYEVKLQKLADFLAFLFRVANVGKGEEEDKYQSLVKGSDVENWVENVYDSISNEEKKELQVFFQKDSHIAVSLLPYLYSRDALTSIEKLQGTILGMDEQQLVREIIKTSYEDDSIKSLPVMERIKHLTIPEEEKWKMIYFAHHPNEVKQRLSLLLKQMYERNYMNDEKQVLQELEQSIDVLKQNEYQSFIHELASQHTTWNDRKRLIVVPSYSLNVGFISHDEADFNLLIVGLKRFNVIRKMRDDKEVLELLKILTDERRFNMLRLLKRRAHYGYEIAQSLGISNSTVSHHLAILLNHGFVQSSRDENKVYYSINQGEVKSVIRELENLFLM
ncbi:metalloregulator ArsR/SmtB family transcription factor [Alkalibacillus silvisoli]|uniref:Metalloregulator ArsR/SmtB family transcription factor n=1 Tax=Alkalibacillus silvisoli TaxID=392823 RepID=A0ABP3JXZ4_9BACI